MRAPYERKHKVDKTKLAKLGVKLVIGAVGSAAIGTLWKAEKIVTAVAEAYIDKKSN
jgi:hypothetical protein